MMLPLRLRRRLRQHRHQADQVWERRDRLHTLLLALIGLGMILALRAYPAYYAQHHPTPLAQVWPK